MRTLHPQWGGYGYTWRRDLNAIEYDRFGRGVDTNPDWVESPFRFLINQTRCPTTTCRVDAPASRRPQAQLDFPILKSLAAAGATDYFAQFFRFGPRRRPVTRDRRRLFVCDRPGGRLSAMTT